MLSQQRLLNCLVPCLTTLFKLPCGRDSMANLPLTPTPLPLFQFSFHLYFINTAFFIFILGPLNISTCLNIFLFPFRCPNAYSSTSVTLYVRLTFCPLITPGKANTVGVRERRDWQGETLVGEQTAAVTSDHDQYWNTCRLSDRCAWVTGKERDTEVLKEQGQLQWQISN